MSSRPIHPLRSLSRYSFSLALLLTAAAALPSTASAVTFTVDNTSSLDDGDALAPGGNDFVCDVTPGVAGAHCSLRAAIQEANDTPGSDTIVFAPSVTSISLTLPIPTSTTPMIIDGANASAVGGRVNINGGNTINSFDFGSNAQGSTLKNLVIRNFNSHGVAIAGHGYTIENNYIGVLPTGASVSRNTGDGINVTGIAGPPANIPSLGLPSDLTNIATITADLILAFSSIPPNQIRNNLISGNEGDGIEVFSENAAVNIISGNLIGTNASGLAAIPNGAAGGTHHGVLITSFAYANVVGPGNVISGNTVDTGSHGVALTSGAVRYPNFVAGNIIGPSSAIVTGLGNSLDGIYVDTRPQTSAAPNNPTNLAALIGPGNIIGYNGDSASVLGPDLENEDSAGIAISGSSARVRVQGNFIGVGEDPVTQGVFVDIGNHGDGIIVTTADHLIGGNLPVFANVISSNERHGISVRTSSIHSLLIQGNLIGRDPTDQVFQPNAQDGIRIFQSSGITIGGIGSGEGNTIAGNTRHGIKIGSNSSGFSNLIARNRIYSNGDMGIDLDRIVNDPDPIPDPLGLDPNPAYANAGQNQPVVCNGSNIPACAAPTYNAGTGATTFNWRLNSAANTPYTVEAFVSNVPDPSGSGEGEYYLGTFNTTTNAAGFASGMQTLNPAQALNSSGRYISLTVRPTNTIDPPGPLATGPANNTSEFSNAAKVPSPGTLQFTAANYSVSESTANITITVTRTNGTDGAVSVNYLATNGTAVQPGDYGATSGTLNWAANDSVAKTFMVPIVFDSSDENDETVTLTLSGPTGGASLAAPSSATLTIQDDDLPPTVSIGDVALNEGINGTTTIFTFTLSLSTVSSKTVSVTAASANNTATLANLDYVQLAATTITFNPGQATRTVNVTVNGDNTVEASETFFVNLTNPSNASLGDAQGVGTIIADEVATVSIANNSKLEGNSGSSNLTFTVTRSSGTGTASVTVASANGSATSGSDYVAFPATVVNYAAGETVKLVNVSITGDTAFEPNETFTMNLSSPVGLSLGDAQATGTITNDDSVPSMSISDVSQNEGNAGDTSFNFTVTLSNPSSLTVTVSATTVDQTAFVALSDYVFLPATTVIFQPGQISRPLSVLVTGDSAIEPDESFRVMLSSPSNANLGDNQGIGTILNDDGGSVLFGNGFE
jgi:hypothetical protein